MTVNSNTKLAKRLKARLERNLATKSRQKARRATAAKAKNRQKGDPPGPHADESAPLEGVLGKGDSYAWRGFVYLQGRDGRGVYRNFDYPHLDEIRELVREHAEFPGGPPQNFDPDPNQQSPYGWDAHHLIPGEAFYSELDGKPVFSDRMLKLILQSKYNVNHGHNMIFLPSEEWACPVHTLLCHPSDHKAWTERIMKNLKMIADDLQEKIDALQPHEALSADVFEQLKNTEESAWKVIVKLSKVAITGACAGVRFVDDRVKWETKKKKYQFPALG